MAYPSLLLLLGAGLPPSPRSTEVIACATSLLGARAGR